MKLKRWIRERSAAKGGCYGCGDRACTSMRRWWRRLVWRRGRIRLHEVWYCAPQCFEHAVEDCITRAQRSNGAAAGVRHRIPLGLLMISRGHLTNQQLRTALEAQRASGCERLGQHLERLGYATESQVTAALGLQWSCPVLLNPGAIDLRAVRMLPYRLLERYRILPLQFVEASRVFHLAFCEGVDYNALCAIEQMIRCRTEPCLVGRSVMDKMLEQIGQQARHGDFLFEGWRPASDMARIASNYALKLGAEETRIVSCNGCIWVRLQAGRDFANLLFRSGFSESQGFPQHLFQQPDAPKKVG